MKKNQKIVKVIARGLRGILLLGSLAYPAAAQDQAHPKADPNEPRPVLGGTLGLGGVNLAGGCYWGGFGLKGFLELSGTLLNCQADLSQSLMASWDRKDSLDLCLVVGHMGGYRENTGLFGGTYKDYYNLNYLGVGLELNLGAFFFQGGPALAEGTGYKGILFTTPVNYHLGLTNFIQVGLMFK